MDRIGNRVRVELGFYRVLKESLEIRFGRCLFFCGNWGLWGDLGIGFRMLGGFRIRGRFWWVEREWGFR